MTFFPLSQPAPRARHAWQGLSSSVLREGDVRAVWKHAMSCDLQHLHRGFQRGSFVYVKVVVAAAASASRRSIVATSCQNTILSLTLSSAHRLMTDRPSTSAFARLQAHADQRGSEHVGTHGTHCSDAMNAQISWGLAGSSVGTKASVHARTISRYSCASSRVRLRAQTSPRMARSCSGPSLRCAFALFRVRMLREGVEAGVSVVSILSGGLCDSPTGASP